MSFNLFDWFKEIGTDLVANRSIPFDGDGNELTDGEGNLNVKQSGSIVELVDNIEIRDDNTHSFDLANSIPPEQAIGYKNMIVQITNEHDSNYGVRLNMGHYARDAGGYGHPNPVNTDIYNTLYQSDGTYPFKTDNAHYTFTSQQIIEDDVSSHSKEGFIYVPALSNIITPYFKVYVEHEQAPTEGSLSITCILQP